MPPLRPATPTTTWSAMRGCQSRFKRLTRDAKATIRTGEHTPYANAILQSGVDFR